MFVGDRRVQKMRRHWRVCMKVWQDWWRCWGNQKQRRKKVLIYILFSYTAFLMDCLFLKIFIPPANKVCGIYRNHLACMSVCLCSGVWSKSFLWRNSGSFYFKQRLLMTWVRVYLDFDQGSFEQVQGQTSIFLLSLWWYHLNTDPWFSCSVDGAPTCAGVTGLPIQ